MVSHIKRSTGEKVFDLVNFLLMILSILVTLLPFLIVLSSSFVSESEFAARSGFIIFPRKIDLKAYRYVLSGGSAIFTAYKVTVLRIVIGTALNLIFTAALSYGLSKKKVPGKSLFTFIIVFTMFFGGGLIPYYLLVRGLGLLNKFWVMIVPSLISAWYFIILRNFFMQIPESLEESARIDGANDFVILLRIILPLSLPAMATIGLFYAVGHWNSWFDAMIFIRKKDLWPVQVLLRLVLVELQSEEMRAQKAMLFQLPPAQAVKMATIVVTTLPIVFIYPFIQKYFVKGVIIGALKG